MNLIQNTFFEGERPCFATHDSRFEKVKFYPGESAIKHSQNIALNQCEFMGKYPLWHDDHVLIEDCLFTVDARAAIWYSHHVHMRNTRVEAPKMFREVDYLKLEHVTLPNAEECCWNCRHIEFHHVEVHHGDYFMMNGRHIEINQFKLQGNYSFQDAQDVVIRNAHIESKDAFWGSTNVTVYDSVIDGEYLGWHSTNLRLINCTIRGTQALCYAENLIMENCTMEATDLCFEYSTVNAEINSHIISIKNPKGGLIQAPHIDDIIIDQHCLNPGACQIIVDHPTLA